MLYNSAVNEHFFCILPNKLICKKNQEITLEQYLKVYKNVTPYQVEKSYGLN